jgi:hypothetical protein
MVRQNILSKEHETELLTSWQPGSTDRIDRKGPGTIYHSKACLSDLLPPTKPRLVNFPLPPKIAPISGEHSLPHMSLWGIVYTPNTKEFRYTPKFNSTLFHEFP